MRTTVTLDPDVERLVRASMRERGLSFKQALNQAVRVGLSSALTHRGRHFVQKTYSLGPAKHFRWNKALAAAQALEDEELSRKVT